MKVSLRPGVRTVRHIPPPDVEVNGPMPLIKPEDPDHKQIQEVWTARVRVFRLKKEEDIKEMEAVWQSICDNRARISECSTQWSTKDDNFVTLMRWSNLSYVAPPA